MGTGVLCIDPRRTGVRDGKLFAIDHLIGWGIDTELMLFC
jgi:hypothetical protein